MQYKAENRVEESAPFRQSLRQCDIEERSRQYEECVSEEKKAMETLSNCR